MIALLYEVVGETFTTSYRPDGASEERPRWASGTVDFFGPQSHLGVQPDNSQVVRPQNGAAVLNELMLYQVLRGP